MKSWGDCKTKKTMPQQNGEGKGYASIEVAPRKPGIHVEHVAATTVRKYQLLSGVEVNKVTKPL